MRFLLTVSWILFLSACSSQPYVPQMEIRTVPAACTTECQLAAKPTDPDLKSLAEFIEQYSDTFRECRLKHKECVNWHLDKTPQPEVGAGM